MPPPARAGGYPVTNIRNVSSPHWRACLKPESRCLVPANSFAEYAPEPNPDTNENGNELMMWPDGGYAPFRGEKGTTWEAGVRVPCFAL